MTQTLVRNYIHIVLSTQKREPMIHLDLQDHLFKYIGGVCKNLECQPIRIGGFRDHVHILCALNKNLCLVELVEEIKIASARWVRNKFDPSSNFSWQRGYTGVSVARDELAKLSHYIETQKEHHSSMTLQAELQRLMMEDVEEEVGR
jgi:putative transposase